MHIQTIVRFCARRIVIPEAVIPFVPYQFVAQPFQYRALERRIHPDSTLIDKSEGTKSFPDVSSPPQKNLVPIISWNEVPIHVMDNQIMNMLVGKREDRCTDHGGIVG